MPRSQVNPQPVLRPQDLAVLLRLSLADKTPATYAALGAELNMPASEVHAAVGRAAVAQLARKDAAGKPTIVREALKRFLLNGAAYAFPALRGGLTRGFPTGYAAPPLRDKIVQPDEPSPVWPHKNGNVRGVAFYPLYPALPDAAERHPALRELLVLFDALRGGSMRERALAHDMLAERLAATG